MARIAILPIGDTVELCRQDAQIIRLKAEGKQDDAIAAIVGLTPGTVKARYTDIYKKLGAKNGAEAAKIAEQRGLLPEEASEQTAQASSFTKRELDIAQEVANGLKNTDIAKKLQISVHKVQNDIVSLLAKTGSKNRIELTRSMTKLQLVK